MAYFLRLMEKFDFSYRLEDGRHSLIARPGSQGFHGNLTLLCQTGCGTWSWYAGSAIVCPGLISALTVRLSYADTGMRWRNGVFLRHPNASYASEALMELASTDLRIEVRAPLPDLFLHVGQRGKAEAIPVILDALERRRPDARVDQDGDGEVFGPEPVRIGPRPPAQVADSVIRPVGPSADSRQPRADGRYVQRQQQGQAYPRPPGIPQLMVIQFCRTADVARPLAAGMPPAIG